MLNKELYNYILELKTANGENLSEDQILDICLKHRNLKSGKDWKELAKLLGVNKSPEALRLWAKRRDNRIKEINNSTSFKSFEEEYKTKTIIRDAWNTYRNSLREEARIESLYKGLAEAIEKLPSIGLFENYSNDRWGDIKATNNINVKEAVLLFSDLHIGVKCSNFYNQYNSEIAKSRVESLIEDVINYCKIHCVSKLNILNLGDSIHGIIHNNARLEQEFNVIDQVTTASEIIAQALTYLQDAAPEVTYRSVTDNHSRIISNKEDSLESENLSKLIDFYLKTRLEKTKIKFINDNLDEGLGMFELINGKKFAFSHGHQEQINAVLQNICGATQSFVDYFAMGHLHSNKLKEFQGMSLFINGSICGTEQYALGKRLFNKASQRLLIFDNTDNVVDIKINLQPTLHMVNKKFD